MDAIILSAPLNITIAIAIPLKPAALRAVSFGNKFTARTNAPKPTAIVIRPMPISYQDILPIIFKAMDKIKRDVDILEMAFAA
jgi:hypothetical protein